MKSHPGRQLTLLDAMVLVAGTAMGLALTRWLSPVSWFLGRFDPTGLSGRPWTDRDWAVWADEMVRMRRDYLMPLIASWTVTVLALRMRKPRPRMSRLMAQPGAVACMMATASLTLWLPMLAIQAARHSLVGDAQGTYSLLSIAAASAVGSSWITLLAVGRWRAEAGWVDRLGRLLGLVWIWPVLQTVIRVLFL